MLAEEICLPSGAYAISDLRPTAHAVGYWLPPLRGYERHVASSRAEHVDVMGAFHFVHGEVKDLVGTTADSSERLVALGGYTASL